MLGGLILFFLTLFLFFILFLDQMCRTKSRASRKINFEANSQTLTISSLTEKSVEDVSINLQV